MAKPKKYDDRVTVGTDLRLREQLADLTRLGAFNSWPDTIRAAVQFACERKGSFVVANVPPTKPLDVVVDVTFDENGKQ